MGVFPARLRGGLGWESAKTPSAPSHPLLWPWERGGLGLRVLHATVKPSSCMTNETKVKNRSSPSEMEVLSQTAAHPALEFAEYHISFTKFLLQKHGLKNNSQNVLVAATCCVHAGVDRCCIISLGFGGTRALCQDGFPSDHG